jgi:putative ABC transport system ATP-binding protein
MDDIDVDIDVDMLSMKSSAHLADVTVRTEGLGKVYRRGAIEYEALKDVTITIKRGELVSIVGPSGSGKTTLLNLIGTLDRPTTGEVYINGVPTSKLNGKELATLRGKTVGFIFQSYNLIPYLNAIENVGLPLITLNVPNAKRREKAGMLLAELGLAEKADKKPNELSGGEQQRVAIARALVNSPSLILADEPTGNLDSKTAKDVASLLKGISEKEKVTIIMVTHNLEITGVSDRIIYLRDGSVEKEIENI